MAVDRTPLVNGQAYAYVDITVNILGIPLAGITSIVYSETSEITNNYGAGRRPVSRSNGKIEATATITIDRAEFNSLVRAAPGRNLMNIPEFDMTVAMLPEASAPTADILRNCRFKTAASGGSEGDANIVSELELVISNIDWDAIV